MPQPSSVGVLAFGVPRISALAAEERHRTPVVRGRPMFRVDSDSFFALTTSMSEMAVFAHALRRRTMCTE
jgi:hypothetical protein